MTEQLKEELEQLRQKLKAMEKTQKETAKQQHHPVYIKSERKIPKLAGRPTANSDPEVDDWVTDIREHIASIPTKEGKIDFVLDHLTGSAKTEVRLRPTESKETAEDILKIIEDTYKSQDSLAQLRHKFYERIQGENETLEAYSLSLMKMLHNIEKKEGSEMQNKDKILTDKFIDGVNEQQLKRELRRFSMENASLPFIEFRGKMLLWVDDQKPTSASVNKMTAEKKSTNDEILEMMKKQQDILEKQQQQIELLTKMNQQPTYYHQPRGRGYNNRGRGRGRGFGRGFGRGSKPGNITCYYCKAE